LGPFGSSNAPRQKVATLRVTASVLFQFLKFEDQGYTIHMRSIIGVWVARKPILSHHHC
jgi:hypothetical protein